MSSAQVGGLMFVSGFIVRIVAKRRNYLASTFQKHASTSEAMPEDRGAQQREQYHCQHSEYIE